MAPFELPGQDRRRYGRIRSKDVSTRFGEVIDMSASGMRVLCDRQPAPAEGSIMLLELSHPQGSVEVKSRVVRRIPTDQEGVYQLGIAFEDVNPTTAAGLLTIARLAMQSIAVDYLEQQPH